MQRICICLRVCSVQWYCGAVLPDRTYDIAGICTISGSYRRNDIIFSHDQCNCGKTKKFAEFLLRNHRLDCNNSYYFVTMGEIQCG